MFDIAWQEVLVIGIVALIVVGPKELPTLLRTVGKYVGMIKRQASEFRAQFDEAMRETEIEQLKKDVEKIKTETETSLRDIERTVDTEVSSFKRELDETAQSAAIKHEPDAHDANGLPLSPPDEGSSAALPPPPSAGAAAVAAAAAAAAPEASPASKVPTSSVNA